uniref:BEN domain-containing protein n=1 Tax=Zeugodacus cucurbitae TaxID=28588 RepID=A0A0A1XNJ0_ZEUCU
MEMLPILSKAQMLYENDVMCNAISIEDILPLINRWLVEYRDLMNEDFNQLHLVTQKSIETKYLIAQRISLLCEKSKRLFQIIERNRAASSTSSQTTNTDDSGSTSSGSSTSESALPNIVASPKPADQLNDDVPSTSRSCYTTPTRWSIGSIKTVHRITYENPYCADPRKRVLREMNREANLNGTSTSTNIQCEDHAASSTGSSITTSTENLNDSIVDSGNNRNVLNYTEETQSTNSSSVAGSMPMPSPPTAENAVHCTVIGPNGTSVPTEKFNAISFMSSSAATRSLLCMIFPEEVLATNTLSGKSSPAFLGNDRVRPQKGQLDPKKVEDIMHCVMSRTSCSDKEVRLTITTKCADSTKKFRRLSKTPRRSSKIKIKINKLNIFRENKL